MPDLPPRLAPQVAFPPYTYVPGRTPHPTSDPAGHSFGISPHQPSWPVSRWAESREHCHAIDLFNHGYYWEAHEVWEGLWQAAGRTGALADVFKGLIKLAAAGVKTTAGVCEGRRRHARRASELFEQVACMPEADLERLQRIVGLPIRRLTEWARGAARDAPARCEAVADAEPVPRRVFSFVLVPESAP